MNFFDNSFFAPGSQRDGEVERLGSRVCAGNKSDGKTENSNKNSAAPQMQKIETNAEIPDGGHGAGKGYRGFTDDRHSHAPVKRGRYTNVWTQRQGSDTLAAPTPVGTREKLL